MSFLRALVAFTVGLASTLIAYAAFYVRGDMGAIFRYLGARGDLRRLKEAGADPAALGAASAKVHALADAAANPELAVRAAPFCVLLGIALGYWAWQMFKNSGQRAAASDVQERMLLRYAYRSGGRVEMEGLLRASPLEEPEARALIQRLEREGRLKAVAGGWELQSGAPQ